VTAIVTAYVQIMLEQIKADKEACEERTSNETSQPSNGGKTPTAKSTLRSAARRVNWRITFLVTVLITALVWIVTVALLTRPSASQPTLTSTPAATLTPAAISMALDTSTSAPLPTSTPLPTLAPQAAVTFAPIPTDPPTIATTPMPSPTTSLGGGGCFSVSLWKPYAGSGLPTNEHGCWQIEKYGMFANDNLTLSFKNLPTSRFYGIYARLPSSGEVQFTIQIDQFTTMDDDDGNIAFAIVPSDRPDPNVGVTLFFKVETSYPDAALVKLKTHERGQAEKYIRDLPAYEFGEAYRFRLVIVGSTLAIYREDQPIAGPFDLPFADRSLWVGYYLPAKANLSATISDIVFLRK
jgi:hypothetical protein